MRSRPLLLLSLVGLIGLTGLVGCAGGPTPTASVNAPGHATSPPTARTDAYFSIEDEVVAGELVIYALGLLGTGYKFGGRNPDAGLDCSGMVSYIVEQISGQRLPHNAARIADMTRPIRVGELQPGDLVFFNTQNRRHSHMGIYMGEGRFVHAPSSRGRIRVERLDNRYFKPRIDGARRLIASAR